LPARSHAQLNRQRNQSDSSESSEDDGELSRPHASAAESAAAAGERAFAEYLARSDRHAASSASASSSKGRADAAVRVYEAPVKNDLHGLGFDAAAAAGPEVMRLRARQSERDQRDATARAGSKVRCSVWPVCCHRALVLVLMMRKQTLIDESRFNCLAIRHMSFFFAFRSVSFCCARRPSN
jgi:hypothetical protein